MKMFAGIATSVALLSAGSASAAINVAWASWTNPSAGIVGGNIAAPGGNVGVTFTGPYLFAQTNNVGTDYWRDDGYTQGLVNRPTGVDVIALNDGGMKTITFSQAVTDPYLAFTSWNGNTVTFSAPFQLVSEGCGYWGCGSFNTVGGTGFSTGTEVHGVLKFIGTFTSLSFTDSGENWHGFTVGIADVANGVPEPATWAMMIAGFGLVGVSLRSRRRVIA